MDEGGYMGCIEGLDRVNTLEVYNKGLIWSYGVLIKG